MVRFAVQIVSLFCVALGQPAFFAWLGPFAASLGFALYWKSLEGFSLSRIAKVSFVWFFFVQLIQLSWMADLEYQGIYILILYFLLSAGIAWQFSFITKLLYKIPRLDWIFVVGLAGLWTLLEWSRLHVLCGIAFNFLGISLGCYTAPLQMASLFGVLGMSFWVMISNIIAWQLFRSPSLLYSIRWALVVLVPYLYGYMHLGYQEYARTQSQKEPHSVLLVQTALSPSEKYCLKGREEDFILPLEQWERMFQSISPHKKASIELIALPEAVVPFGFDLYVYALQEVNELFVFYFGEQIVSSFPLREPPFASGGRLSNAYVLQTLANFFSAPVVAGLDYQEKNETFYNSAFYFDPGSKSPKRYDKRILLPLAESMPFSCLTFLSQYYGIKDFFTPGSKSEVFPGALFISPSICYEELFPSLIREGRKKGAKLLVNLSNDGWYPSSKLPIQHFTQGLIRAVENGVPLVRACNTGVTAGVDSLGRVVGKLQDENGDVENVSGCLILQVPSNDHMTGFVLWGETPLILASVVFGLILFWRFFFRSSWFFFWFKSKCV